MTPALALPRTAAVVEAGIRDRLHPGAQLYVSLRGAVMADCGFGESRPAVPMRPDHLTLWLSAGKPITAFLCAVSLDRKQLDLDDLVTKFIPEFGNGGKQDITIRHLLTHTAGFRDADKLPEQLDRKEVIQAICGTPIEPGWIPGETAGYQTWSSWQILAEILERTNGLPFEQIARRDLFDPLGLENTRCGIPEEEYSRHAHNLSEIFVGGTDYFQSHPFFNSRDSAIRFRPGSNTWGPVRELGRFYEQLLALREGRKSPLKLGAELARAMTSRQRAGLIDRTFQHKVDWGFGFLINATEAGLLPIPYGYGPHASTRTFGHGGAQSASAFADPQHELVVAWVCNGLPGERAHQKRAQAINSSIYEDLGLG